MGVEAISGSTQAQAAAYDAPAPRRVAQAEAPAAPAPAAPPAAPRPSLEFRFSVEDGKARFQMLDPQTGAVVRQVPSEELVAIARAIDRMQGLLVRQKA